MYEHHQMSSSWWTLIHSMRIVNRTELELTKQRFIIHHPTNNILNLFKIANYSCYCWWCFNMLLLLLWLWTWFFQLDVWCMGCGCVSVSYLFVIFYPNNFFNFFFLFISYSSVGWILVLILILILISIHFWMGIFTWTSTYMICYNNEHWTWIGWVETSEIFNFHKTDFVMIYCYFVELSWFV